MTICPECKPWAATTHRQFANRIGNMVHSGSDVKIHPCPNCGGIDWALTDMMIQQEEERHSWGRGWNRDQIIAGLAALSAVIIIVFVLIGWWQ